MDGDNYLVPIDAKLKVEVDLRLKAFELAAFMSQGTPGRRRVSHTFPTMSCSPYAFSSNDPIGAVDRLSHRLPQPLQFARLRFTSSPHGYSVTPGNGSRDNGYPSHGFSAERVEVLLLEPKESVLVCVVLEKHQVAADCVSA